MPNGEQAQKMGRNHAPLCVCKCCPLGPGPEHPQLLIAAAILQAGRTLYCQGRISFVSGPGSLRPRPAPARGAEGPAQPRAGGRCVNHLASTQEAAITDERPFLMSLVLSLRPVGPTHPKGESAQCPH